MDDTCCILRKDDVDELLHHLNSIRPTIKFTMEVEEGGSLPFLDTRVTRKEDGKLDITVYRKQTHTDRYLHFRSHHPTHVKRGTVRCLYNCARCIAQQGQNLKEEEDHLMKAFMGNGYPRSFIRSASVPRPPREHDGETEEERPPTVHLPYVAGVSERIRRVCRDFNIRAVFKSGPTLRSLLTKVKDPLPREKQANVVYEVPCTCGKVYIGETTRRLGTRLKEHKDACIKGFTDKSAIAEHAWTEDHPIRWDDTRILQHASRSMELVVKEAICIRTAPESSHFNRDGGYDIPDCWITTYRKLESGTRAGRSGRSHRNGHCAGPTPAN